MRRGLAVTALVLGLAPACASAQMAWPGYVTAPFRWDEDYSKGAPGASLPARLKHLALGGAGFVSLGGEYRSRMDTYDHPDFGARGAPDFTSNARRLLLHADAHLGPDVRAFVQLGEGFEAGRTPVRRAGDEGHVDLAQGFVDLGWGAPTARWRLRLGRQEVGIGRYVAVRDGTNVRRAFDGGRIDGTVGGWTVMGLAARPTQDRPGAFDDTADHADRLLAFTAEHALPAKGYRLGFAVLERDNRLARYAAGSGRERRTTLGVRVHGADGPWDADGQVSYQFGRLTPPGGRRLDIEAWGAAFEGARKLDLPWAPRLGVRIDAASGDGKAGDGKLGTFDLPYPNLSYLTDAAIFAPRNLADLQPFVAVNPTPALTVTLGSQVLWRMSRADSVYSPVGLPVIGPGGGGSHVATSPYGRVSWRINPLVEWQAAFVHASPGEALKAARAGKPQDFGMTALVLKF